MSGGVEQLAAPAVAVWSSVWEFVQEQLALLPAWARAALVVAVVGAAIASKWIIPALADLARAKGERKR